MNRFIRRSDLAMAVRPCEMSTTQLLKFPVLGLLTVVYIAPRLWRIVKFAVSDRTQSAPFWFQGPRGLQGHRCGFGDGLSAARKGRTEVCSRTRPWRLDMVFMIGNVVRALLAFWVMG